jgi:hypothetical protein
MTRATALLLQLTLWVATTHAFFPYIPNGHCAPDEHCGGGLKRSGGLDPASEGITIELYRRPAGVSLAEPPPVSCRSLVYHPWHSLTVLIAR